MSEYGYQPPEIQEEENPRFNEIFLDYLRQQALVEKFGEDTYHNHQELMFRKAFEGDDGMIIPPDQLKNYPDRVTSLEPLLPEIQNFSDLLEKATNQTEIIDFAKEFGVELTEKNIQQAKYYTKEELDYDKQHPEYNQ